MNGMLGLEQQRTHCVTQGRTARLPSRQYSAVTRVEVFDQPLEVRALTRAVDALERDEQAWHADFQRLSWYFCTARLCSSSVRENCELPSPRDTK